ncbi:hypothetical protein A2U01_0074766, partial [Trifolium medium]|nr:hypothetical protein [Trifolium medium]
AELPVQVVAGVGLSAAARPASSPYEAFWSAPAVLDISDASLVVATTSGPTYFLQGQYLTPLPLLHAFLASRVLSDLQTLYPNCHNQIELARLK